MNNSIFEIVVFLTFVVCKFLRISVLI
jgi:hypothetical protein